MTDRPARYAIEWNFATFATLEDRIQTLCEPWARHLARQIMEKRGCDCIKCGVEMMSPRATVGPEIIGWADLSSEPGAKHEVLVVMLCRPCASGADTLEGMARIATKAAGELFSKSSGGEVWTEPVLHSAPKRTQ